MSPSEPSPYSFLFSSFTGAPRDFFHGYAFADVDFVHGQAGYEAYRQATGREIRPGEDGSYVVARQAGDGVEFGTDYSGLQKLYYFTDRRAWCVSNSLSRLAEHLREHGIHLGVNVPQLAAFGVGNTLTAQLSSFETPLRGVRLVPSMCTVILRGGRLRLRRLPPLDAVPHEEALATFLGTWRGRITTLLADPRTSITSDLTGGMDSRAVLAMIQSCDNGSAASVDFLSNTSERLAADLRAATAIAERYGIQLNRRSRVTPDRASGPSRHRVWRELSLGTYLPVYFHLREASPFHIHFHGGGGENHRLFYPYPSVDEFLAQMRTLPPRTYRGWRAAARKSIRFLTRGNGDVDPLILHYREFRNRLHSGRAPQYGTVIAPLSSKLLDQVSAHRAVVTGQQINIDIMENLLPGLADMPYDEEEKRPGAAQYANVTAVTVPEPTRAGRAYTSDDVSTAPTLNGPSAPELLAADLAESVTPAVRDFVGDDALKRANAALDAARRQGKFAHASDAKRLSYVLAVAMVFRAAGR